MTTYTEQELIAAVQAGYHVLDDLPLATRSWLEGYRAGRSNPQPVASTLPTMQKAFVTAESGNGKYCLVFKFRTLGDLQAAHNEWVTQPAPQPVVPDLREELVIMIGLVKEICHCRSIPLPEASIKRAEQALLSAGKEAV